ncbi:DUF302 domain-containing protein [Candidatus Margulisiibacteriota bacterium]
MYGYKRQLAISFEQAEKKAREELAKEGFGVLTEINVAETLKKKLGVDFDKYLILGACNPPFAYKALLAEQDIGLLLPCNVIIYEQDKKVYASAIKPTVAMNSIENAELETIAKEIEQKLIKVIDNI